MGVMDIISLVGSASIPHSNPVNSPSQDAGLVSKDGYKIISSLTLYVPENIDIDRLLLENPPDFEDYHRDKFVYIMHLITSIPSKRKELIENGGFVSVNRKLLQRRIHNYKSYIDYLKSKGIIEENRHYVPSKYSMGLRFSARHNSRIVPVRITKWTLIKGIVYLNRNINEDLTSELEYLKVWFNDKLEVDYEGGVGYLNELYALEVEICGAQDAIMKYNARLLPFMRLRDMEYSFFVDQTGFRLHTSLTQIKGSLRRFIKYEGKTLCAVDIKNSQPYLAISLLDDEIFTRNNLSDKIINPILNSSTNYPIMVVKKIRKLKNKPDVLLFKRYVSSGSFYENFGKLLVENGLLEDEREDVLRDKAKEITFTSIYSSNYSINQNVPMQLFREQFPNVFAIFKLIKKGYRNHPAFSICLQRLEAELVLHKICKVISEERPDVFIATLHDSVITTEDNVEYVESIMYNVLKEFIGVEPSLKRERWE